MADLYDVIQIHFTAGAVVPGTGQTILVNVPLSILMSLFVDFYECNEAPAVSIMYDKSDRVLDAGAGIGYITSLIADRAEFVVGVEGIGLLAEIAVGNLSLNNRLNAIIVNNALGLDDKPVTFYERHLVYASSTGPSHDSVMNETIIDSINANTLIAQYNLNALHFDLEGTEADLLDGIDLTPIRKVFLETHPHIYGSDGIRRIILRLRDHGLEPFLLGNPHGNAFPWQSCTIGFTRAELIPALRERIQLVGIYFWTQIEEIGEKEIKLGAWR